MWAGFSPLDPAGSAWLATAGSGDVLSGVAGALLAAGLDRDTSPLAGYESCAFPDAVDTGANLDIGYIPGPMPWLLAEGLRAHGLVVVNEDMAGHVHRDRGLLTGDSPLAANALGKLAAATLVERATKTA